MRVIYPKSCPNQTCDYRLITPNQQTLCIETNIFFNSGQLPASEGSITKQRVIIDNTVNGAMSITINRVINNANQLS